jgi:hypothetical protein
LVIDITKEDLAEIEVLRFLTGAGSKRQVLVAGVHALTLAAVKNYQMHREAAAKAKVIEPAA